MKLNYAHQMVPGRRTVNDNVTINLDWPERYTSVLVGASLFSSGISNIFRHPLSNLIKSAAGGYLLYRGLTGHCPLYSKVGKYNTTPRNVNIKTTFLVNRPRMEVYSFWRQLDNLPLFMRHLKQVTVLSPTRSHWEAKLSVAQVSWDAEIVEDQVGFMIGWQSVPGSTIHNAGKVDFKDAPGGQGTIVNVVISYTPPAGGVGTAVGQLLNPVFEKMVREDVNNFKNYLEAQGSLPAGEEGVLNSLTESMR